MKSSEVKYLYKYYPIGKNQLNALAQGMLWYSKPARFNDPFDTRFYVDGRMHSYVYETDTKKIEDKFESDMSDANVSKKVSLQPLLDKFREEIEELGILSLATSNKNLLMCCASMKPDTNLGGIITTQTEVFYDKTTSLFFSRV